ncbi:MAG: CPBP family intramembrane metalloprotease [Spirochaetaceae bacterium]|jgi:membrane protease YdiL (CAAX protease family)|nr:CPBP family intramembrane metalloprotease [Spirochaetaceae bacterium]
MKNVINWKLFFVLLIVCVITSMLVIPYSLALTSSDVEISAILLLLSAAQNLVLFSVATFCGLFFSKRIGMGMPILQNVLEGKKQSKELKSIITPSVCLGILAGILIVLLSIPFNTLIPELQLSEASVSAWKAFLASFYGGIAEEILLRLFLVSLFVWISFKIKKTKDGHPTDFGIWVSIIAASVIFGLGHLPVTAQITSLTGVVVIRAIVLNGVGGVIFGWLYWKKGLESAIIAHFSTDIVLHIITPLAVSFFS